MCIRDSPLSLSLSLSFLKSLLQTQVLRAGSVAAGGVTQRSGGHTYVAILLGLALSADGCLRDLTSPPLSLVSRLPRLTLLAKTVVAVVVVVVSSIARVWPLGSVVVVVVVVALRWWWWWLVVLMDQETAVRSPWILV